MENRVQFAEFVYDSEHGLLVGDTGSTGVVENRLPPQPARLLTLLLDQYPNIVTRKTIQETLWPDVIVDFDRSLHFCIRQVRTALGESATEPRFIETIPRRGYRWMVPPVAAKRSTEPTTTVPFQVQSGENEPLSDSNPGTTPATPPASKPTVTITRVALHRSAVLLGTIVILLGIWLAISKFFLAIPVTGDSQTLRIAIMPFEPATDDENRFRRNVIAIDLVEALTNQSQLPLEIVGPTTTEDFQRPGRGIRQLINEYSIDYVINGKFTVDGQQHRMLAEIIRASDGAHLWVRSFDFVDGTENIPGEIARGMTAELQNSNSGN